MGTPRSGWTGDRGDGGESVPMEVDMGYTEEEVEDCWVNRESRKLLRALSASVGVGLNDDGGAVRRGGCLPFPFVCTA